MIEFEIFPDRKVEPSIYELLRDYPTASHLIRRNIKTRLNDLKLDLELLRIQISSTSSDIQLGYFEALQEEKQAEEKHLRSQLRMLTPRPSGELALAITANDIWKAKQTPISTLIKVNRAHKAVCLFHGDKEPSMHIYGTYYHCFSCGAHGDSISIVMKLHNLPFIEAVKRLI